MKLKRIAIALGLLLLTPAAVLATTQIAIRDSDGRILNYGTTATGGTGITVCSPDSPTLAALATAQAGPNGGVSLTGYTGPNGGGDCAGGTVTVLPTPTPVPTQTTITLNANAGSGASIAFVAGSNAERGAITWTAGTTPLAGAQFTVTFPVPFGSPPVAFCVAATRTTAPLRLYSVPSATNVVVGADAVPTAGATYVCQYIVAP